MEKNKKSQIKYKIKDINLHSFGRKEINLAHTEMPGLISLRKEFQNQKPLLGVRITGSLHMTIQTAVLIETLKDLGADIRWSSCNIFSTQDHAAAAIVKANSASVFAWKGETVEEYWWCLDQALTWPDGGSPELIVDDGGDACLLIHEGVKAEKVFEKTKKLPDLSKFDNNEQIEMYKLITKSIKSDPSRWRRTAKNCKGLSEETTTGVSRMIALEKKGKLLFPVINVNDSVTKSKFDNIYGCKHSLPDGIKRATDVLISGKKVLICGFGDVGKGCASAMKGEGARVIISEIDPICALQACMEGYDVKRIENVLEEIDIFVTATGNKDIITLEHMKKMKNNAIVCNIGHFDTEIQTKELFNANDVVRENIKPQVDRFVFKEDGHGVILLAEGRLVNLGCATGHPSFVMSNSFTNQVIAQLELFKRKNREVSVTVLPKIQDEKVARLHLNTFGAELTVLSDEQSEYSGIPIIGPYKPQNYRY